MKLKFILNMLIPIMRLAVSQLRTKDENSTGWDDVAADQLDTAITSLQQFLSNSEGGTLPQ